MQAILQTKTPKNLQKPPINLGSITGYLFVVIALFSHLDPRAFSKTPLLEFIREDNFESSYRFESILFGGISGACFNNQSLYLVSDDKGPSPPPRIYKTKLNFDQFYSGRDEHILELLATIPITPSLTTKTNYADFEAIVCDSGIQSFMISSEPFYEKNISFDAYLLRIGPGGLNASKYALPKIFTPKEPQKFKSGFRSNSGFEGLIYSKASKSYYAINEDPLIQDGFNAHQRKGGLLRLINFRLKDKSPVHIDKTWLYRTDRSSNFGIDTALIKSTSQSVSEILNYHDEFILVLERSALQKIDGSWLNSAKLYAISFSDLNSKNMMKVLNKKLLFDFESIKNTIKSIDNLEAMSLVSSLEPNSKEFLIVASDNNFNATQRNQFLIFSIN